MALAGSPVVLPLFLVVQSFPHITLPTPNMARHHSAAQREVVCFFVLSHHLIPLKLICHCFILHMSMALRLFKDPSRWVRNILKWVFIMPPPKGDD